jgi:hypothetical protein
MAEDPFSRGKGLIFDYTKRDSTKFSKAMVNMTLVETATHDPLVTVSRSGQLTFGYGETGPNIEQSIATAMERAYKSILNLRKQ